MQVMPAPQAQRCPSNKNVFHRLSTPFHGFLETQAVLRELFANETYATLGTVPASVILTGVGVFLMKRLLWHRWLLYFVCLVFLRESEALK